MICVEQSVRSSNHRQNTTGILRSSIFVIQSYFGVRHVVDQEQLRREGEECVVNSIAGRIDQELRKLFFAGIFNPCAIEIELPISQNHMAGNNRKPYL